MNVTDQLWLLKQIYKYDNSYFDDVKKMRLYRTTESISAEDLRALEKMGHMPNQIYTPRHDEIIEEFCRLSDTWTLKEAGDAFIAGLWSMPFIWQSALTAKVMAMVMPTHEHTSYGNSKETCAVCGYRSRAIDITQEWYFQMLQGTPLDGDPIGHVLALKEMERMGKRPIPTEYDWWVFRAILTVIRSMPPKTRYSKVRDVLCKEKLLPTSKKETYGKLLEALALIGILDTEKYPGMAVKYTTYRMRDERPNVRVEVQAPLAWWDSSTGINEAVLKKIFPTMDCSSVDLAVRPTPIPPLAETITGQFEKKRSPRRIFPKSPDAGTGPAEAGDVYAILIRDNIWVTMYCHRIEGSYVVAEFLDGVFTEMPLKTQIQGSVRLREGKRWQTKVSGIDRTVGVRRVARNIAVPVADMPEQERLSFTNASSLKFSAEWCFRELR